MPDPTADARGAMAVVPGIDALTADLGRLFIVIGVFDGLHLGHAYLLEHLSREAARLHARPTVITFDHHPDEILTGAAPPLLCDPAERLERLAAAGVEVTVVQHFDVALRETLFDTFVRRMTERVGIAGFLMTPDSAFGYQRGGTPQTLAALGRQVGFDVVTVPPFSLDGEPVRSTDVRGAIASGDLAAAERLLGRPVSVRGSSRGGGDGAATELDFPLPVALPPTGRYHARVAIRDTVAGALPAARGLILVVDGPAARLEPAFDTRPGARLTVTLESRPMAG